MENQILIVAMQFTLEQIYKGHNSQGGGQASILHSITTVLNDVMNDETVHTKVFNDKR